MALSTSDYQGPKEAVAQENSNESAIISQIGSHAVRFWVALRDFLGKKIQWMLLKFVEPERSNNIALALTRVSPLLYPKPPPDDERLTQRAFGLVFGNPVGVAAGLDKNATSVSGLFHYGFGFVEVGTVTSLPQLGNDIPRVFRVYPDEAIINRFGFNSDGEAVVLRRLASRSSEGGIVGINIGANKNSVDRVADYVRIIRELAPVASYFAVNVSSPNTPGLRELQQGRDLDNLLARVTEARDQIARGTKPVPMVLKIAPDLNLNELDDLVSIARTRKIDGIIVGNTTVTRPGSLYDRETAKERGGLSGRPLFKLSTRILAETYVRVEGAFPLIGVGGIDSGATAIAKIKAGASLIQLHTGLIYKGIVLVSEIKSTLLTLLRQKGLGSITAMVGADAADITAESWPT
jgi:dihydroorotate dehydrogenase